MKRSLIPLLLIALLAAACGTGGAKAGASGGSTIITTETEVETDVVPTTTPVTTTPTTTTTPTSTCPSAAHLLDGVYHPTRLQVSNPCFTLQVTVMGFRHETDGDIHIYTKPTDPSFTFKPGAGGYFIVEYMARDGGHLSLPVVGETITVTGSLDFDADHGWNEIHPVYRVVLPSGKVEVSGPQFGGSPATDSSTNAAVDCRDQNGHLCVGYPNVVGGRKAALAAGDQGVQPVGDSAD